VDGEGNKGLWEGPGGQESVLGGGGGGEGTKGSLPYVAFEEILLDEESAMWMKELPFFSRSSFGLFECVCMRMRNP
jgi:hypothetical protein